MATERKDNQTLVIPRPSKMSPVDVHVYKVPFRMANPVVFPWQCSPQMNPKPLRCLFRIGGRIRGVSSGWLHKPFPRWQTETFIPVSMCSNFSWLTSNPDLRTKKVRVRQHFPIFPQETWGIFPKKLVSFAMSPREKLAARDPWVSGQIKSCWTEWAWGREFAIKIGFLVGFLVGFLDFWWDFWWDWMEFEWFLMGFEIFKWVRLSGWNPRNDGNRVP